MSKYVKRDQVTNKINNDVSIVKSATKEKKSISAQVRKVRSGKPPV